MEHAVLLQIIEKIVPILEAAEVLLDIGVDGDLNSNKTLNNIPCVNKVYADLKHIGKNIRAKIGKLSKIGLNFKTTKSTKILMLLIYLLFVISNFKRVIS